MAESYDLERLDAATSSPKTGYENYGFYEGSNSSKSVTKSTDIGPLASRLESPEEIAVQIRDVTLSYGRHKVLDGINMNVPVKKIYGLLGPSGCGQFA